MTCGGCGNTKAYKTVSGRDWEYCDRCGDFPAQGVADVYWDGTAEHGLPDDPKTGQPRVFSSKAEKARFLKENHLIEAGDKQHGAPPSVTGRERKEDPRAIAAEALSHVRQMGIDQRRQAYIRILKETGRM